MSQFEMYFLILYFLKLKKVLQDSHLFFISGLDFNSSCLLNLLINMLTALQPSLHLGHMTTKIFTYLFIYLLS